VTLQRARWSASRLTFSEAAMSAGRSILTAVGSVEQLRSGLCISISLLAAMLPPEALPHDGASILRAHWIATRQRSVAF